MDISSQLSKMWSEVKANTAPGPRQDWLTPEFQNAWDETVPAMDWRPIDYVIMDIVETLGQTYGIYADCFDLEVYDDFCLMIESHYEGEGRQGAFDWAEEFIQKVVDDLAEEDAVPNDEHEAGEEWKLA